MATAEKKAVRATSEGLIAIACSDDATSTAMVEVQCETDFCARNEVFRKMVTDIASLVLSGSDGLAEASDAISQRVQEALAKIGENMSYARGIKISAPRIGTYLHHNGKVAVVIGLDGNVTDEVLGDLCMHIAFADPLALTVKDIPSDLIEREKRVTTEQAIESGKPPEIAEKIVAGKMRKFLESKALLDQPFVRDDKKKVREVIGDATVTTFARFAVGE